MRPGRNDPCPCGSGKKFEHCCGLALAAAPAATLAAAPGATLADPRAIGALVGMVSQGLLQQAEARTRALLQAEPAAGMLWKILSVALLRQGKDALPALRRAAELLPQDAEAYANLGSELHARGEWQAALSSLRHALTLQPRNPEALIDAADAERALGRAREAVTLYQRALNNLGNVLREQGERREALSVYQQAVQLDPSRADSHCNLGYALLDSRRPAEAVASFGSALALQANSVPAHLGLAAALRVQGLSAEAEASCQAALAAEPRSPGALSLLGELRADRGRFAEAQELFERAIALDPDFAPAYGSIAAHRRMSRDDAAWLEGAERVLAKPLALSEEIHLRYALGKYFDDVAEYDKAFSSYQAANEL